MPASRIIWMSSWVVMTASMVSLPSGRRNSGRMASYFFAVQGMTATLKIFFPGCFWAKCSLITEPNICMGLRQVEMFSKSSGCRFSA